MVQWHTSRGRGEIGRHSGLKELSARPGNRRSRTAQSRGNLEWQSRAKPEYFREGVETRWAAPKPLARNGEGIVQTTNSLLARRRKPKWYENPQTLTGRGGSSPPARTTLPSVRPRWNHPGMFLGRIRPALARNRAMHASRGVCI